MGWADGTPAVDYTINASVGLPWMTGHADDCRELLDALEAGVGGADVTGAIARALELQERDDVFRDILPSIELALERAAR